MKRDRVAIITSGYFPIPPVKGGAIESLVYSLYEENIKQKDIKLTIFSMYDEEAEKQSQPSDSNKIDYVHIPQIIKIMDCISYFLFKNVLRKKKHMSYRYIIQRLYYIHTVSKRISENNYDKVIIENHPTLLGVFKKHGNKERYKGKYYYHIHNEINNMFGNEEYLKDSEGFICVSKYIGNTVKKLFPGYPENKIHVLRNRVDEVKFRNIDNKKIQLFRKRYKIPERCTIFTFTGRLNPEKGVKELLEAFKKARPKDAKLVIAGSYYFGSGIRSEYESELIKLSEDIKDEIIFTGNIDYEDMPYMYAVSDVIVLPSIWNDPAPLTVIESLTCGKPLITTYSGGIPEYANENNSVLLEINDNLVDNLSNALTTIANDTNLRNRLILSAKQESDTWKKSEYYDDFINIINKQ